MDFKREEIFDGEQYETYLRRIHYDDRDTVMYENMLRFLWEYVIRTREIEDYRGILEEYTCWNLQMIDKCLYHPHDLPYANIRRAYQSVVDLLAGKVEEGLSQLAMIGADSFSYDGKAPKLLMTEYGKRYQPVSKLFLLYNYDKVLRRIDRKKAEDFRNTYPFAFREFADGKHEEHDHFLCSQTAEYSDCIFYPVFEKVYKEPWKAADFYMYFEEGEGIPLNKIMEYWEK